MFALRMAPILLSLIFLQGCELGFIIDNTKEVTKTLGFEDSYDLKRNHNFIFSRNSTFSVAAIADEKNIHQSLLGCAELAFSRYYTTTTIKDASQLNHALRLAQANDADFLAVVSVIDGGRVKDEDGNLTDQYIDADLLMDIYDVNSHLLADKLQFTAGEGGANSLREMLRLPMLYVVKELVGDS